MHRTIKCELDQVLLSSMLILSFLTFYHIQYAFVLSYMVNVSLSQTALLKRKSRATRRSVQYGTHSPSFLSLRPAKTSQRDLLWHCCGFAPGVLLLLKIQQHLSEGELEVRCTVRVALQAASGATVGGHEAARMSRASAATSGACSGWTGQWLDVFTLTWTPRASQGYSVSYVVALQVCLYGPSFPSERHHHTDPIVYSDM